MGLQPPSAPIRCYSMDASFRSPPARVVRNQFPARRLADLRRVAQADSRRQDVLSDGWWRARTSDPELGALPARRSDCLLWPQILHERDWIRTRACDLHVVEIGGSRAKA